MALSLGNVVVLTSLDRSESIDRLLARDEHKKVKNEELGSGLTSTRQGEKAGRAWKKKERQKKRGK